MAAAIATARPGWFLAGLNFVVSRRVDRLLCTLLAVVQCGVFPTCLADLWQQTSKSATKHLVAHPDCCGLATATWHAVQGGI